MSTERSRRIRRVETQSKKQLKNSLITVAIIFFVLLTFGPYVIGFLGGVIETFFNRSSDDPTITTSAPVQAPVLDPIVAATSSGTIKITGHAFYSTGEVELFLNSSLYDTLPLSSSQEFEFKNVRLVIGTNAVKIRVVKDKIKSEFSQEYSVTYLKGAPELEIASPNDKQSFGRGDQNISVSGKTDNGSDIAVNGFRAIVDSEGNFSYTLTLQDGENKITVVATNQAGNSTSKELTVSYSP
ncbi:MAG: hypothetical protein COU27_00375 [Candidatus Levybacteria bacterium CG10_big_fil_rev_8_21_14_0_10_36_7]|nr:MAG: hypothetical protein COU27_00375 [Candidatus Levybacteria bacterium CG10_big_fil_rev_8_21_14_0_10_36_7]